MNQVKRFRADHRHVVETEFDDAQFVSVADYDALQQRLTVAEEELQRWKGMHSSALDREIGFRHSLMLAKSLVVELGGSIKDLDQPAPGFTKKAGKSARAPAGLKRDQIVEVFGGGENQIGRVDKTDWRHVEIWRIKP